MARSLLVVRARRWICATGPPAESSLSRNRRSFRGNQAQCSRNDTRPGQWQITLALVGRAQQTTAHIHMCTGTKEPALPRIIHTICASTAQVDKLVLRISGALVEHDYCFKNWYGLVHNLWCTRAAHCLATLAAFMCAELLRLIAKQGKLEFWNA